jgi:hypothetical protein
MFTRITPTFGVGQHRVEGGDDPLGARAAADIEEVRGLAPGELDHVHRGHGEARAVDDAADVAVEAHIGEPVIGGHRLARVLLRRVAQRGDLRAAEERVGVEAHLGVERHEVPPPVMASGLISTIIASRSR